MKLLVQNYSCNCACSSYNIDNYFLCCNEFSYEFLNNTYVLLGEIDCGAWAFVSSISAACKMKEIFPPSQLFIDQKEIDITNAKNIACYLHERINKNLLKENFYHHIERIIKLNKYKGSVDELFDLFKIPDYIARKNINELGEYTLCFNAIKGLIKGEKIFTSAWLGQFGFNDYILNKIAFALETQSCIFLVPSSSKNKFTPNFKTVDMLSLFHKDIQAIYS